MYTYSDPDRAHEPQSLPNVEVFYVSKHELAPTEWFDGEGWYWWACFPGCLPDGDPMGPYTSQAEAVEAAQEE